MDAGRLDRRVTIMSRNDNQEDVYGTRSITWGEVATVWAEVQDMLPSRAERIADGVVIANRPCRVRMRWRADVSSANRLRYEGRELRIIAGPAELGRREGIELVCEELTTEGSEP
jgi:SPP1 family predicted phage head-tail adaptor